MSSLLSYFGIENAYELRWAHATNSRYLLKRAIEDPTVNVIEVDIMVSANNATTPPTLHLICCHPPNTTSDLTLIECLDTLWGVTQPKEKRNIHRKGLKLDLKTTNAVIMAKHILAHYLADGDWPPLILNSDILPGPGFDLNSKTEPVDWHELKDACKLLPFAGASLGWITELPAAKRKNDDANTSFLSYTDTMIDDMLKVVEQFGEDVMITVVFRACFVVTNRGDRDTWWEDHVLTKFLGRPPATPQVDEDGDVVRNKKEDIDKPKRKNINFLLWSHGRDDLNGDLLQQFVLRQNCGDDTGRDEKKDPAERKSEPQCELLLDLHSKHAGMLDNWEIATFLFDRNESSATMPKLIMKHVGEKFPNNKRFRYT